MEEEGDVVYFENSPELHVLRKAELELCDNVYHTDDGDDLSVSNEEERLNVCENDKKTVFLIKECWRKLRRQSLAEEQKIKDSIVNAIRTSPLLTTDDSELLEFVLGMADSANCKRLCHMTPHSKEPQSISHGACLMVTGLLVVFVAVLWMLLGTAVILCFLVSVGLVLVIVQRAFLKSKMSGVSHMINYLEQCERFLSLLTQFIQTIQERELVYHGFDRPSVGVPINRLELHISQYQCIALRRRVYILCEKGVCLMRSLTRKLIKRHPLNLELDDPQCYLALRKLSELHKYLGKVKVEEEKGVVESDKPPHLSLQSLKMAASLVAISNSELLRRITLQLGEHCDPENSQTSMFEEICVAVTELNNFMSDSIRQLQWSLEYHQYPLISQQTTTPTNSSDSANIPQTSLVELEVHSADMHTLTALNKLRELNVTHESIETLEEKDRIRDEIKAILNNLFSAEKHLRELQSYLTTKETPNPKEDDKTNDDDASADETLDESQYQEETSSSSDEEDERIYEAMVTSKEESESHDSHVDSEEYSNLRNQRDASLKMLHELNSVLAVRKVEKQKKAKRKGKRSEYPSHDEHVTCRNESGNMQEQIQHYYTDTPPLQHRDSNGSGLEPILSNATRRGIRTCECISGTELEVVTIINKDDFETIDETSHGSEIGPVGSTSIRLIALAAASRASKRREEVFVED